MSEDFKGFVDRSFTELGKLITEEPAMDEHEELEKIHMERSEQEIIEDLKALVRIEEEQTVFPFVEEVPFAPKDEGVPDKEVSVDYTELQLSLIHI